MKIKHTFLLMATLFIIANSCKKEDVHQPPGAATSSSDLVVNADNYSASVATDWYRLQLRFLLEKNSTLAFGGFFGYIGIGLYESVRNIDANSVSFSERLYQMPAMPTKEAYKSYNWEVSANAAMADLTRSFFIGITKADSTSIDSLETAYNNAAQVSGPQEFARSQSFGKSIAAAIHNWYLTDNINLSNVGYVPPVFKGSWVPTPPAFVNPPVLPYVGEARTYLAANLNWTAPPLVPYSENKNSAYYKIAKDIYNVSKHLTDEQKTIANYYVDQGDGVGYTPPGHDMSIVTQAIEQNNAHLLRAAETYAKAGIAERDATIVCFRSKYKYNRERPVTYIQKLIDPNWLPYIPTPPHPEYPAAHAFITGSVMQAAAGVLGNNAGVTDHTYDFRGWTPRSFNTLFDAGKEAGISRLYGGIHYRLSIDISLVIGKGVGTTIGDIKLHNGN